VLGEGPHAFSTAAVCIALHGALVRMHYTNEPETRLAFESLNYFQHWGDLVGGQCGFEPVGLLVFVPPAFRYYSRPTWPCTAGSA
jgi:hypothetical protein